MEAKPLPPFQWTRPSNMGTRRSHVLLFFLTLFVATLIASARDILDAGCPP